MTKVKVIEIEATKLDPNALYLIIFSSIFMTPDQMSDICKQLEAKDISFVAQFADQPKEA